MKRFPANSFCLLAFTLIALTRGGPMAQAASHRLVAGELSVSVSEVPGGLRLNSLFDSGREHEFLLTNSLPLFQLTLRRGNSTEEARIAADVGWNHVAVRRKGNALELLWENPDPKFGSIAVVAKATAHQDENALYWEFRVENHSSEWSTWRAVFPQLALASMGNGAEVLFPRGPGELQPDVWKRAFTYHGNYPGGWCSMQFFAAYNEAAQIGLYVGLHDPWGSTKDLFLESEASARVVRLGFDVPVPDMGVAGNDYKLSGPAVWRLLRGDWFDAALIYRHWASREARWWPKLTRGGRRDTPPWMLKLNAWAQTGGAPSDCTAAVERFQSFLDLPIGFHWYNWHQIPFDNDYPHYLPPREGFAQAVGELQRSNVFVMPYINGRLWDIHDRGTEDFEFTSLALPAATKNEKGEPRTETYGSKETNGEPVKLAVMCPTTPLWQKTVRETVLRLLKEQGTRAVYIDQIAAAAPALCMDKSHGHPLGGGHWWNEGYWALLSALRREMPRDCMITTECNGEPFIRWFDGYLTWHWQFDGQVPAFPAIYGGAVQMFGRAYRGGATKDLALRMKAGQQLVFGEQLGWIDPNVVNEPENAKFFREAAWLRSTLSRYFAEGQMRRAPNLAGPLPKVKADWQWSGEWWVTTDALLVGSWAIPAENRVVFLFANVSDQAIATTLQPRLADYGCKASKVRVRRIDQREAAHNAEVWVCPVKRELSFQPLHCEALELSW